MAFMLGIHGAAFSAVSRALSMQRRRHREDRQESLGIATHAVELGEFVAQGRRVLAQPLALLLVYIFH